MALHQVSPRYVDALVEGFESFPPEEMTEQERHQASQQILVAIRGLDRSNLVEEHASENISKLKPETIERTQWFLENSKWNEDMTSSSMKQLGEIVLGYTNNN